MVGGESGDTPSPIGEEAGARVRDPETRSGGWTEAEVSTVDMYFEAEASSYIEGWKGSLTLECPDPLT